jgi:hypothetical protein
VGSPGEDSFLHAIALQQGEDTWLGLSRDGACDWQWVTGEPLAYTGWGLGQPDGACPGGQDCLQYWSGVAYQWDNNWCNDQRTFLCEWE